MNGRSIIVNYLLLNTLKYLKKWGERNEVKVKYFCYNTLAKKSIKKQLYIAKWIINKYVCAS